MRARSPAQKVLAAKTAFVTGGASGIGHAVVEMLATRGIRVAIADKKYEGAQSIALSIKGAIACEVNVADWDSQVKAFEQAVQEFGRIDYVFAIAGIGERKGMPNDPSKTEFVKPDLSVLDVDLDGLLYSSSLAIQQMRRQEPHEKGFRGKIAVTASTCGWYCIPTLPMYTAAKHGVVGFVRSYGKHLPTEAITLNAVCPKPAFHQFSTQAFYEEMESRDLIIPMDKFVKGFEMCLDGDISGETLEIDPHDETRPRPAPEPHDKYAADLLEHIRQRALPMHEPEKKV